MVSVQNSRLLHVPRLVTWLMRDQKGLSTMDNEIWLEKIHFKLFLLADRPALRRSIKPAALRGKALIISAPWPVLGIRKPAR